MLFAFIEHIDISAPRRSNSFTTSEVPTSRSGVQLNRAIAGYGSMHDLSMHRLGDAAIIGNFPIRYCLIKKEFFACHRTRRHLLLRWTSQLGNLEMAARLTLNVMNSRGHRAGCSNQLHGLATAVPCQGVHVVKRGVVGPGSGCPARSCRPLAR